MFHPYLNRYCASLPTRAQTRATTNNWFQKKGAEAPEVTQVVGSARRTLAPSVFLPTAQRKVVA